MRGIFQEGAYSGPGGDMNELKDFVLARMMWDTTLNASVLIDDFLTGYYGAAGPHVRTYMDVMHGSVSATAYYMRESFDAVHAPFMTPDVVLTAATAFAAALAAPVAADVADRVLASAMAIYWVVMPRWGELQAYALAHGTPWPLEASLAIAFDTTFSKAFNATAARYGALPSFREGQTGNLTALRHELIGDCPAGWIDSPCTPICPSGAAALQWFPVTESASHSWHGPPAPSGEWNAGDYAPQWLELDVNLTAGNLVGIVAVTSMDPAGNATHAVSVDGNAIHTWSGAMTAGENLMFKLDAPMMAKSVRVSTTVSPSWVSWAAVSLYFCPK